MTPEVAQGQIWKEKGADGIKCYITRVLGKPVFISELVYALYSNGTANVWPIGSFKTYHEYTGDHVPFEDVAAILF